VHLDRKNVEINGIADSDRVRKIAASVVDFD
jgi:hypothetical protein